MTDDAPSLKDFPPAHPATLSVAAKSIGAEHEIIAISNGCVMTEDGASRKIFELTPQEAQELIKALAGTGIKAEGGAYGLLEEWHAGAGGAPLIPASATSPCIKR